MAASAFGNVKHSRSSKAVLAAALELCMAFSSASKPSAGRDHGDATTQQLNIITSHIGVRQNTT